MSDLPNHQRTVDELLVRSIARWSSLIAVLILALDWAVLQGYPFPGSSETLRGVFYGAAIVVLVLATIFVTFLGYRIVTMRVARGLKALFFVFLPAAVALGSVLSFLALAAPA